MKNQTNSTILKRTIGDKRVLIEHSDRGQAIINSLLQKHRSRYLSLWKASSVTNSERTFMNKFDRIIGKLRKRQYKTIGTW